MDLLTILGLATGAAAIILGQMIEGGSFGSLVNGPALLIVLGGTLGAIWVQTPYVVFKRALGIVFWIFKPPKQPFSNSREKIIELSRKSRQFGLLSLENAIDEEKNPILKKGLELLIIGVDKQMIRQVLEDEIDRSEDHDLHAARVFESMGGYSPTIGIMGAVLGLIQVMSHLGAPNELGAGIAVAFVATIYGVGFANLVFLPIANKLKRLILDRSHHDQMLVEGIVAMANGENPNMLQLKLNNYGQHHAHEKKATQN